MSYCLSAKRMEKNGITLNGEILELNLNKACKWKRDDEFNLPM